jgi:hypothetical protein
VHLDFYPGQHLLAVIEKGARSLRDTRHMDARRLSERITRQDIVDLHKDLYGTGTVPSTWIFNDFGPLAIRWFKDLNGNRKLDGRERLSGQMFHTTPENEAQQALGKPVLLGPSHGCIHLKPADRNKLFQQGAFKPKRSSSFIGITSAYHEITCQIVLTHDLSIPARDNRRACTDCECSRMQDKQ